MRARWFFSFVTGAVLTAATALAGQPADMATQEMGACRAAVVAHLKHDGYHHLRLRNVYVRNAADGDTVTGTARAEGWYIPKRFSFTCSMNADDGSVRSVQVGME